MEDYISVLKNKKKEDLYNSILVGYKDANIAELKRKEIVNHIKKTKLSKTKSPRYIYIDLIIDKHKHNHKISKEDLDKVFRHEFPNL